MMKFERSIWGGPDMVAILEVEGLRAGYATGDVLQGISMTVASEKLSVFWAETESVRAR